MGGALSEETVGLPRFILVSRKFMHDAGIAELDDALTKADGELAEPKRVLVLPVFHAYLKVDEIPGVPGHQHSFQ